MRWHNNQAYMIRIWSYDCKTRYLFGRNRQGLFVWCKIWPLNCSNLFILSCWSKPNESRYTNFWVERFQKDTIFQLCDLNPSLCKWANLWKMLTGILLHSRMENHLKILKYNDQSFLHGNQLTHKLYA